MGVLQDPAGKRITLAVRTLVGRSRNCLVRIESGLTFDPVRAEVQASELCRSARGETSAFPTGPLTTMA
jgi:hypothetical protein